MCFFIEKYGLKEPLFEEFGNGFKVTMFRKVSDSKSKTSAIQPQKLSIEVFKLAIQGTNYKEATPTNLMLVYEAIEMNQVFGASKIMNILDCSSSTAREMIKKLKDMKVVVEVKGQGKATRPFLISWYYPFKTQHPKARCTGNRS